MYLHCPRCQTSVEAARLVGTKRVCPGCGEPAQDPLSFFSSMPTRYRRRKAGDRPGTPQRLFPLMRQKQDASQPLLHR